MDNIQTLKNNLESLNMDQIITVSKSITKFNVQRLNISEIVNKTINNKTNNEIIELLGKYTEELYKYVFIGHEYYHESAYAYDKAYRKDFNEKLNKYKQIKNNLTLHLEKINKISKSIKINSMTSANALIGELIIDCYIKFDYQYCFNLYYQDLDFSLCTIANGIFANPHFSWSKCVFLQEKYTSNLDNFKEFLLDKSQLYMPFSIGSESFYENHQTEKYKIIPKYKEENIFVKKKSYINIDALNETAIKIKKLNQDLYSGEFPYEEIKKSLDEMSNTNPLYLYSKITNQPIESNVLDCSEDINFTGDENFEISISDKYQMVSDRYNNLMGLVHG